MKGMRYLSFLVLLMLILSGCSPKAKAEDEAKAAAQAVQDFYSVHIPSGRYDTGNPRDYEASPVIHPELVSKIQAAMKTEMGIGFDPFLCAQAWPQTWGIANTTIQENRAQVLLQTTYGEHKVPVTIFLEKQDGRWKINATSCFPEMITNS